LEVVDNELIVKIFGGRVVQRCRGGRTWRSGRSGADG
jgi:hypothetical protein